MLTRKTFKLNVFVDVAVFLLFIRRRGGKAMMGKDGNTRNPKRALPHPLPGANVPDKDHFFFITH